VEFHWPVRHSPRGKSRAEVPVLCWKREDGPTDAPEQGSLDDVGPAWLETQDEYGNRTSEPISDGNWVTRQEVLALAAGMGYTLSVDD
jgi:hypothetical protein